MDRVNLATWWSLTENGKPSATQVAGAIGIVSTGIKKYLRGERLIDRARLPDLLALEQPEAARQHLHAVEKGVPFEDFGARPTKKAPVEPEGTAEAVASQSSLSADPHPFAINGSAGLLRLWDRLVGVAKAELRWDLSAWLDARPMLATKALRDANREELAAAWWQICSPTSISNRQVWESLGNSDFLLSLVEPEVEAELAGYEGIQRDRRMAEIREADLQILGLTPTDKLRLWPIIQARRAVLKKIAEGR